MTKAERAAFEKWFTEFRSEFHDIRKAGSSPYTVSLRAWMVATKTATSVEREAWLEAVDLLLSTVNKQELRLLYAKRIRARWDKE